ncbi:haloacid dehalogenase superfamily, subfamily IA, variant 3 with third motif having DD or ED/haloacid dehalogenase superfamily, subfamily IA, variant 1 with third motif having Dx(3-4)D or Dx(3-4)E [Streptoalloteichus tenebrarius]|uniref:Haloacid dehalogenase superfamily, subfamily IA, variant 3 with third motif having DD or ED/haloacid dehalogenase superfamily, subfamily IA, variant 1 with third motif having Dx(3-4)D or Dx(3-4)E n=1 Tax=Streptoalloteichus tenebrarius (strain ATCC 17920 / DSM 40477 / JCM 4838 / CBS 697.72 / NBRC 16177 / NCIMB 11028 / NRRL B-12390 / A12253. 1 / ISP 5477) TaxID=1933 RepID=A0ABT1HT44_STRSD|nr:HAD-IA family hydrolase [Streptoalloteichus tenebrarius]MCP2258691.1 haloacid dehalogenase superfamily, subfamily IA, variant 3 with third motif having DD or ED/haloacid dehalogenase superfamily, subfamily IA, variant 1 with third motif having Dx(3-4)D or Dx(3-4)E [Streptoalloteichus tenebrarius]BFF02837.1 HAD-IA family hydrolase [Streptoalloteichus tenebrarius]
MDLTGLVLDYGGVLTDPGADATRGPGAEPPLVGVLRLVRAHGLRTALLSNAEDVPRRRWPSWWHELFDEVVLSGAVGMAKPDRGIYLLTARRLGLPPEACVFVDDLAENVRGAARAGMVGVRHVTVESTVDELEILFGLTLH